MLTRSLSHSISNLSQCSGPSTSDNPTFLGPSHGREAAEFEESSSRKRGHSRERYRPTKRVCLAFYSLKKLIECMRSILGAD